MLVLVCLALALAGCAANVEDECTTVPVPTYTSEVL